MRLEEFAPIDEDLSRRGFLGGVGAAAAGIGTGAQAKFQSPQAAAKIPTNPNAKMLLDVAKKYITNPTELAQFMAHCASESTNFTQLVEKGNGTREYFNKKYDAFDMHGRPKPAGAPGVRAAKVLGNTQPGDGERFKGRGFIQVTGRWNYTKASERLSRAFNKDINLVKHPEWLEDPSTAAYASLWFWLNQVAPKVKNFHNTAQISKKVNGAVVKTTHQKGREENFKKYQAAIGKPVQVSQR